MDEVRNAFTKALQACIGEFAADFHTRTAIREAASTTGNTMAHRDR